MLAKKQKYLLKEQLDWKKKQKGNVKRQYEIPVTNLKQKEEGGKKMKTSRKKNYVAVVNGALWRNLIGKNVNNLKFIKESDKEFYFFSNSKNELNPVMVFDQIKNYCKDGDKFCFGIFRMKNNQEYYFLCKIDTLYIDNNITHIHGKPKVVITKKKINYEVWI